MRDLSKGVVRSDSSTVSELLDRWLDHIASSRSPTTVRGYRGKIRRIDDKLGSVRLSRLTAQHLDRAYLDWLDEGLHPTSVHHLHAVLSAALNQAVRWSVVPDAVTRKASPPPLRVGPKIVPSPDAVQRLIAGAEERGQPVLATAIAIAATTGVRRGELLAVCWSDVDLDTGLLHVRRAIKHADGPGWVVGATKTHAQRRIPLDGFSVKVLRRHLDAARLRALRPLSFTRPMNHSYSELGVDTSRGHQDGGAEVPHRHGPHDGACSGRVVNTRPGQAGAGRLCAWLSR
ncbi:MAG: site-specific integrase [Actinomycetota bacterium]|nr:site-specific integrase [Actinomycetota bacterium]